jgi:hypothetical protein
MRQEFEPTSMAAKVGMVKRLPVPARDIKAGFPYRSYKDAVKIRQKPG